MEIEDLDSLPLPAPPQHPVLQDDALETLAGEVVRLIEPNTEADPAAIQQAAQFALSLPPEIQQGIAPLIEFAAQMMPAGQEQQQQQPAAA